MSMHKLNPTTGKMEQIAAGRSPFNGSFRLGAPDWSRMEAVNRITASGGEWTVDQDGYVRLRAVPVGSDSIWNYTINGKLIAGVTATPAEGAIPAYSHDLIVPVSRGDVVKVTGPTADLGCWFIPPAAEPVPLPPDFTPSSDPGYVFLEPETNRAKVNADLSTVERLAGYKDDRGKDVYIRTFRGNMPLQTANVGITIDLVTGLPATAEVKKAYGYFSQEDGLKFSPGDTGGSIQVSGVYIPSEGGKIVLFSRSLAAYTVPRPYCVTVEYTKE